MSSKPNFIGVPEDEFAEMEASLPFELLDLDGVPTNALIMERTDVHCLYVPRIALSLFDIHYLARVYKDDGRSIKKSLDDIDLSSTNRTVYQAMFESLVHKRKIHE